MKCINSWRFCIIIVLKLLGNGTVEVYINTRGSSSTRYSLNRGCKHASRESMNWCQKRHQWCQDSGSQGSSGSHRSVQGLRRTNAEKSLISKKRVIKMLCAVVLEFFICWTPLYVINTVALFNPLAVYSGLGYTAISFFQLLAYSSSCCNPITYCFMNCGFRKSFLNLFRCFKKFRDPRSLGIPESEINLENKWSHRFSTRYSEPP